MNRFVRTALAAMVVVAGAASASPITYVHTGFGAGTLNGVAFGSLAPVAFTINATADTDNVASCGGPCLANDNLSASITIDTVGTFDFVTLTRYFSNVGIVGFSRSSGNDLFNGPSVPAWDMVSSIGPIVGTASLLQWTNSAVNTSGGVLVFNSGQSASTFTATVGGVQVAEPAPLALLAIALVALGLRRREGRES